MSRTRKIPATFSMLLLSFLSLNAQTTDGVVKPAGEVAAPLQGLHASGPLQSLADKLRLFGQFVGDWDCEEWAVNPDGSKQSSNRCEWHWGWILGGRAIQDVWIVHPKGKPDAQPVEHGTTIRASMIPS